VAGASKLQRKELTLRVEGYVRIREQARIQLEARTEGTHKFEFLRCEPGERFPRLPAPSAGDIFLDLEGDPFVADGGIEYLFGVATADDDGNPAYECRWAVGRGRERAVFEWFINFTFERLQRFPDLHIFHYGVYEPGAIKRLTLRYATREEQVDRLLRGKVFIDLHGIVKQGVRASVEQYSLKELEKFCGYRRLVPLPRRIRRGTSLNISLS
jgi:predicted RecB family nuclease